MTKDYNNLSYNDLQKLIREYSNYVIDFFEEHTYPEQQVSACEFYENEYQEILRSCYE